MTAKRKKNESHAPEFKVCKLKLSVGYQYVGKVVVDRVFKDELRLILAPMIEVREINKDEFTKELSEVSRNDSYSGSFLNCRIVVESIGLRKVLRSESGDEIILSNDPRDYSEIEELIAGKSP